MKMPSTAQAAAMPSKERLQMLLLAGVAVLLVAYLARVRPMQTDIEEILSSLETESAGSSVPSVAPAEAAYTLAPDQALSSFYGDMENHLKSSGVTVDSRQARIESDPRFPATSLIYECHARGKWPAVTKFLSSVRAARPRIQIRRLTIHKAEQAGHVEIFFEAAALAIAVGGTN